MKTNKIHSVVFFLVTLMLFCVLWLTENHVYSNPQTTALCISPSFSGTVLLDFFLHAIIPAVFFCSLLKLFATLLAALEIEHQLYAENIRKTIRYAFMVFTIVFEILAAHFIVTFFVNVRFKMMSNSDMVIGTVTGSYLSQQGGFLNLLALSFTYMLGIVLLLQLLRVQIKTESMDLHTKLRAKITHVTHIVAIAVILYIACMVPFVVSWIPATFGTVNADQIIFQLSVPLKGVDTDYITLFAMQCFFPAFVLWIVLCVALSPVLKEKICWTISVSPASFFSRKMRVRGWVPKAAVWVVCLGVIINSLNTLSNAIGLKEYLKQMNQESKIMEEEYVDPKYVTLEFPEKKRNLIYIFLESMENTYMSTDLGGVMEENLIPELTALAEENISFSNTDKFGGAVGITGSGWTIAGMVNQHVGVPLLLPNGMDSNGYGSYESFLPGSWALGDVLAEQGYNQTLLVGSDASFGGRDNLYETHGNHKILDLYTAWEDGIVPYGRTVWWGFEDIYLFSYAKQELQRLAAEDEPFSLTMLTADTHTKDGYRCSLCGNEYSDQYWNVVRCSSRQISEFISWIQQQDFYEDTTIVLSGDHNTMDPIVEGVTPDGYERTTFNVIINSAVQTDNTKNRDFAHLDMYPTTLASMGVKIEGDQMGFGVNLFSETPTLMEKYGYEEFNGGITSNSTVANKLLYDN